MRVAVAGGAGFIGSHVIERLAKRGADTLVVDDLSTGLRSHIPPGIPLIEADIGSTAALERIVEFKPRAVIHLAARIDAARSLDEPVADAEINVLATLKLLEACRRIDPIPHLVFASSAAVYGGIVPLPTREESAGSPATPYGVSKLAVELYLAAFGTAHGMVSTSLRFANVYGPRQGSRGEGGVVALFARNLALGRESKVFGDGRQTRDFVYVDDVADAVIQAVEARLEGVYNVSTGVETDVLTVYRELAAAFASRIEPRHEPQRAGDVQRSALSYEALGRKLGWRPRTSIERGLSATAAWFRNEREEGTK